jgi:hypothetical protein
VDGSSPSLKIEGVLIGVVEKVHLISSLARHSTFGDNLDASIEALKQMATFALFGRSSFTEHQLKAFCRAITTNCFIERYPTSQFANGILPSLSKSAEAVKRLLISDNGKLRESPGLETLLARVRIICRGRSLLLTKEGAFSLGPIYTRSGDIVAIILGCQFPLVLRPSSGGRYGIIGEAYCDGFMDGEALLGPIP